jgi:hypothetical protein
MIKTPKSKTKAKLTDAERHKRFVETANKVGASKKLSDFDKAFNDLAIRTPTRKGGSQGAS